MAKTPKREKRTAAVNDMSQIGELARELELSIPKLPELPNLSDLDTTVEGMAKKAHEISDAVTNAVKFLNTATKQTVSYEDPFARKAAKAKTEKGMVEVRNYLKQVFELEDPVYRSAAAIAYLTAQFNQQFECYDEAIKMLNDLADRGLLTDAGKGGPILIGYTRYNISDGFGLDKDDIAQIGEIVAKFSRIMMTLEGDRRQVQAEAMKEESEITLDDARNGKNGKCLVHVPPESFVDRDKNERWRGGGKVLLDFQSKDVFPIRASGSIEGLLEQMVKMDIRLGRHTLAWDNPPGYGSGAFQRVAPAVMESLRISFEDAEEYVRKLQALWYLIRRGVKASKEKNVRAEVKAQLLNKADITPAQFFGLNGNSGKPSNGTALLQFRGEFHQKDGPSLFEPFFLATRRKDGDEEFFELTEVPEHLQEALGHLVGKKFSVADDYRDCPVQLGRLLRGMRGQEDMAAETAKK
jgi:hypothetical protein